MKRFLGVMPLGLCWAALAAPLVAEELDQSSKPRLEYQRTVVEFREADSNRDGRLSRKEFATYEEMRVFKKIDRNRDGQIDVEELSRFTGLTTAEDIMRRHDKNGDGTLSRREFVPSRKDQKHMYTIFDKVDTTKDQWLAPDEFKTSDPNDVVVFGHRF
ncbi:MAG: EF-hand domain-containing protein [Verrucomicrobiae bacterium]|nr:EF-hand domain-containing protein [Verrucomicrobiae bacterium]